MFTGISHFIVRNFWNQECLVLAWHKLTAERKRFIFPWEKAEKPEAWQFTKYISFIEVNLYPMKFTNLSTKFGGILANGFSQVTSITIMMQNISITLKIYCSVSCQRPATSCLLVTSSDLLSITRDLPFLEFWWMESVHSLLNMPFYSAWCLCESFIFY
jgi:hypothetical protein